MGSPSISNYVSSPSPFKPSAPSNERPRIRTMTITDTMTPTLTTTITACTSSPLLCLHSTSYPPRCRHSYHASARDAASRSSDTAELPSCTTQAREQMHTSKGGKKQLQVGRTAKTSEQAESYEQFSASRASTYKLLPFYSLAETHGRTRMPTQTKTRSSQQPYQERRSHRPYNLSESRACRVSTMTTQSLPKHAPSTVSSFATDSTLRLHDNDAAVPEARVIINLPTSRNDARLHDNDPVKHTRHHSHDRLPMGIEHASGFSNEDNDQVAAEALMVNQRLSAAEATFGLQRQ